MGKNPRRVHLEPIWFQISPTFGVRPLVCKILIFSINSFVIFCVSHEYFLICFQWSRNNKFSSSSRVSGYYVSYRCLAAALFIAILVANGCTTTQASYWLIYLTQLGFIIQTLHLMIAAAVPIQLLLRSQSKDPSQINSNHANTIQLVILKISFSILQMNLEWVY